MIEFALCIPIIGGVIMLCFFWNWAMLNQQQVRASARYNAWHYMGSGAPGVPASMVAPDTLSGMFFTNRPTTTGQTNLVGISQTSETLRDLITAANNRSASAGELATTLVWDHLHHEYGCVVTADFPAQNIAKQLNLTGPVTARHVREGGDWRRGQVLTGAVLQAPPPADVLIEQFLYDLDAALRNTPAPGSQLAAKVTNTYVHGW